MRLAATLAALAALAQCGAGALWRERGLGDTPPRTASPSAAPQAAPQAAPINGTAPAPDAESGGGGGDESAGIGTGAHLARPRPREGAAAALCSGLDLPLFIGGAPAAGLVGQLEAWALDIESDAWLPLAQTVALGAQPPLQRAGHSLTVVRDRSDACDVLLLGGELPASEQHKPRDLIFVGRVTREGGLPHVQWHAVNGTLGMEDLVERSYHVAVSPWPGEVYVFGRKHAAKEDNEMLQVDVSLGRADAAGQPAYVHNVTWRALDTDGPQPSGRWHAAASLVEQSIVVSGGAEQRSPGSEDEVSATTVWAFDLLSHRWALVGGSAGDIPRHGHTTASLGSDLVLFGGMRTVYTTGSRLSPKTHVYYGKVLLSRPLKANALELCGGNTTADAPWCEGADTDESDAGPDCRAFHAAVRRGSSLLVFGGRTDPSAACAERGWNELRGDVWELNLTALFEGELQTADDSEPSTLRRLVQSVYFFFGILAITVVLLFVQVLRRRSQPGAHEMFMDYEEEPRPRGVALSLIEALPQVTFSGGCDDESCSICLGEFEAGESLVALPCNHVYHRSCVSEWLLKSDSCPLCKGSISGARPPRAALEVA